MRGDPLLTGLGNAYILHRRSELIRNGRAVGLTSERRMTQISLQSYPVWDRPTRWFHWINFVCVVALAAIGTAILFDNELGVTDGGKILLKTTHVWFGYVFAVNLAWRFAWAFIGNRHASWSAILPFHTGYGAALKTYLRELIRGDVRPYLGHNPVARAMISIFLILPHVAGHDGSRSRWDRYLLPAVRSLDCQLDCGARDRSFDDCPIR